MLTKMYLDRLYHCGKAYAYAVRLLGAHTQYFTEQQVKVKVDNSPYELPLAFTSRKDAILIPLIEAARQQEKIFFDGQNTRLINFCFNEGKSLELTFGRVGWFDFTVEQHLLEEIKHIPDRLRAYVELDRIVWNLDLRASQLTNICSTATIPVTKDGYLMYSRRSLRVSVNPGWFTAGVAENIELDKDYNNPFRTVIRGIKEEFSPEISQQLTTQDVKLLGIGYDLREFVPDLLFMVNLPFTRQEVIELCGISPGVDAIEIEQYGFVIPDRDNEQVQRLLSHPDWSPSGKASLIRCIEFLEVIN